MLARIRHRAVEDLSHIPNFTCLETLERGTRRHPWSEFSVVDLVQVEVAHVDGEELFSWPGAAHFENRTLRDMVGTGMVSNGEYAGHARSVFMDDVGVIRYWGQEELEGHRAARYDYSIAQAFSGNYLSSGRMKARTGVQGSFWADTTTFDLLRLRAEDSEIPTSLQVDSAGTEVDYGRIRIGSGDFLLPQSASTWIVHTGGVESRNRIDFTHCRQYRTESIVSFEPVDGRSDPRATTIPDFILPGGLSVSLRLETPLTLSKSKGGDAVSAVLAADLQRNRTVLAPKGAVISGRLRILRKAVGGYVVGLEFTDLAFENRHGRFFGKLVSVDSRFAEPIRAGADLPPAAAAVGVFYVDSGIAELPKGMTMQWKTVEIGK